MTKLGELNRKKGIVLFARKFLNLSILLQLPFIIVIFLRQVDILFHFSLLDDRQMPGNISGILWFLSSFFAIAGFTIICRQLSLWEGNVHNSELAQRTRLLGSMKIAVGIQLFFYAAFLMPLINLIPVFWARSKASVAIQDIELMMTSPRTTRASRYSGVR